MDEGKSWAKYVAIGCTVVLLLGACGFGLVYYSCNAAYQAATAPSEAAQAFLADLRAGSLESAYARMAESFRSQNDLDAFVALVEAQPALTRHSDATFTNHMMSPDGAALGGFLLFEGRPVSIQMQMVEGPQGSYYVEGLMVDDAGPVPPALTGPGSDK